MKPANPIRTGTLLTALVLGLCLAWAPATAGLIGYWTLNEGSGTIADSAGPTFTNSTNSISAGSYGQPSVPAGTYGAITLSPAQAATLGSSIAFSGSESFALGAATGSDLNRIGDLTVMGWMNSALLSGERVAFGVGPASGYKFATSGNQLRFTTFGVVDMTVPLANYAPATGQWFHYAVTVGSTTGTRAVSFFVNGNEVYSTTSSNMVASTGNIALGSNGGPAEYFQGNLDEIRVYDQVLSRDQIRAAAMNPQPVASTLTWDGTANNWGTAHWTPGPVSWPNNPTTQAVVNSGNATVEANYIAHSLTQGGGQVTVGAGNTLTLGNGPITSTAGTFAMDNGSSLVAPFGGSIANLSINGSATIQNTTALNVTSLTMASSLTKSGSGLLDIQSLTAAPSQFNVQGGTLRSNGATPLNGITNVTLSGGTLELKGVQTVLNANSLQHRGYHISGPDASMFNITGNDGLLPVKPYATPLLTRAAGLDFGSDADFTGTGAVAYTDNYMNMFTGYLNVPVAGAYTFRVSRDDDWSAIWLDLNQDGVFRSNTNTLVTNNGELLAWEDGGTKAVNLQPGKYKFAAMHAEGGGGSTMTVYVKSPSMAAEAIINPPSAGQAGLWSVEDVGAINAASTNFLVTANSGLRTVTDYTATLGSLTMNAGTTLSTAGGNTVFQGGLSVAGGAAGRTVTLAVDNSNLTMQSYTDGGTATNLVKAGGGTLTLNNVNTVAASSFQVNAGKLVGVASSPPLGNAQTLVLNGGTFEAQGSPTVVSNALSHWGFDLGPDSAMNLHNNAGLMALPPSNRTLLTRNVVSLFSDHDFLGTGTVTRADHYMNLWVGTLNVTTAGNYEFKYDGDDDRGMIWVDLNQDGIFQSTSGNLATNNGELLAWEDTGTKTVNLAVGQYRVAIGHGEYTGGSNLNRALFRAPGMAGQVPISPGNPNQAGYWSANALAAVNMSTTDVATTAGTTTNVLRALTDYDATFRDLDLGTNSTLTLSGAKMNFATTDFTPGSSLLIATAGANLGAVRTAGGQSNLGSVANLVPDGYPSQSRAIAASYNDQGIANSIMRIYNAAALELSNNAPSSVVAGSTNFRVETNSLLRTAPTLAATPALGATGNPLVTLAGGTFALQARFDGGSVSNALGQIGYHGTPERVLNLDGTNGIVSLNGTLARVPYDRVRFTDAAAFAGRGLYPQNDTEFINSGAVNQGDNYSNIWYGTLNVTTPGNYEFRIGGQDDRSGIWIDLNQNGTFESISGGLETNNGELIAWQDNATKTINLPVGQYRFAVVHGEFTGGSLIHAYVKSPTMATQALIKPTDAAQAGLWSMPTLGNINAANTNVNVALGSTLSAVTDGTATLGKLSYEGGATAPNTAPAVLPNILTVSGGGKVRFAAGTDLTSPQPVTSYIVPTGTVGLQTNHSGPLGMDFDLMQPTVINSLGVFDSGSDGLVGNLTVRLYDRMNTAVPLATLSFTAADPGTLVGGSRFKNLATPLVLPTGFRGTIVAEGFGTTDPNGNTGVQPIGWTYNSFNGSLLFTGSGRYSTTPGAYPSTVDGGPVNRYAAGTFNYVPGTYSGINALAATTVYPGSLNGYGAPNTFVTQGMGDVVLDQPSTGLERTTIETRGGGGRLIVANPNTVTGAKLSIGAPVYDGASQIKPGNLVLASPNGLDVTYPNQIGATAGGSLIAGTGGVGVAGGALILPNLKPTEGAIVQMKVTPGQADYILLPNGVNSPGYTQANALAHYGYHINNDGFACDLSASYFQASAMGLVQGGMWSTGKPASFQYFYGKEVMTSGPRGIGLSYQDDYDFLISGAIGQVDNYSNLWIGTLTVSPADAGVWQFQRTRQDDATGMWIDLNRNGQFDSLVPGVATDRGEQLAWGDGNVKSVTLSAGTYMVAFTHREGGGGSQAEFQVKSPTMGALAIINPTAAAQNGYWSMPVLGGGLQIAQGETRTLGPLNLGTLIIDPTGALNRAAPLAANRSVTVTENLTLNSSDLAMTLGAVLNTTGATVNINPGSTLFVDHPVNAANLNVLGTLARTGVAPADRNVTVTRSMVINSALTIDPGTTLTTAGAVLNVGPSGSLTTPAPIVAKSLASAGTVAAPGATVADMVIAAGTTTLTGNTTITNSLLGGNAGTLATQGNITLDVSGAKLVNLNSDLRVTSGNLNINAPTGTGLPSGLAAYYSAAAAAVTGANNTVSRLYDLSDFGRDMANVLGTPTYVATNANGNPAIRFYGTDGTDAMWTTFNFDSLGEYSVIAADRLTGGLNQRLITSRTRNWLFGHHGGGDGRWHAEGWITPQGGNANTLWDISAGDINSAADPQANFWYNGTQTATNNTGSGNTNYFIGQLQLGAYGTGYSEPSNGEVSDIFIFNRVLTAAERNAVASYLYARNGATIAPGYTPTAFANPALLGDLRLAPSTSATITGSGTAAFNSIGTTASPLVTGPLTLTTPPTPPTATASADGQTLTLDATINATNFMVSNTGTVALTRNLTIAAGGMMTSTPSANINALNAAGTQTINAATAQGVNLQGGLNVAAGTLTFNVPAAVTMPTGLAGWYDANDINNGGAQPANGAVITDWLDKSGNARNLGGAGNYNSDPNLTAGVLNGKSAVTFDGDDWIRTAYNFDPLTNYTVFALGRYIGGDNERLVSSTGRNWLFGWHGGYEDRWHAEGWIYGEPPTPAQAATTNWRLYAGTMGPGTSNPQASFWRNGNLLVGGSNGSGDANYYIGQLELGAYNGTNETSRGEVAEVLIFNRVLTAAELNTVGGYLASKYGLPTSYNGYLGLPVLGDLTMANGTGLVLGGAGAAAFKSITTGPTASIQGAATLNGDMRVGGSAAGTLNVTGSFAMAPGSSYHWDHDGTNQDLVAVTGSVNVNSAWNLGISLGGVIPDGQYNLFTHTAGVAPALGAINILKENAYAQLIQSATVGSDATRVFLTLDLADVSTWTSNSGSGGTTAWNVASNWNSGAGPVPTSAIPAIVQAPTANQIATVTPAMGTQAAQSLIVDNGGHVLIEPGARLEITNNADVLPTGSLTINGTLKAGYTIAPPASTLSGLVAHWGFDGNLLNDSPTAGLDGTGNGAIAFSSNVPPSLALGQSLQLNGSSWVAVSQPAAVNVTGTYTVAAWAQVTSTAGAQNIFDTRRPNDNGFDMKFSGTGSIHGDIGNGAGWLTTAADASLAYTANTWYHIAYVVTPTGYNVYVHDTAGTLVSSGSGSYSGTPVLLDANHVLNIGRYSGGGEYLTGLIDDVAVWNRALSLSEILSAGQLGFAYKQVGGILTTAGTTTIGSSAVLEVPRINVLGGTTSGPLWPDSQQVSLQAGTTLRLAGGALAGNFNSANTSTTPGNYAFEIENGVSTANLFAPAASLRKSTAGAATLNGWQMNLNTMSIEDGPTTMPHGSALNVNRLTVSGGSLTSNRQINTGDLLVNSPGTLTTTANVNVTKSFQGSGTFISDGDVTVNLSNASVGFTGTLRTVDNQPAAAGQLTLILPSPGASNPSLFSGLIGYWPFDEGAGTTTADVSGNNYNGTISNATWTGGKYGQGLSFNGTNASVTTGLPLMSGLTTFTMAGWVQPNAGGGRIGLFGQNDKVEAGIDGTTNFAIWANGSAQINAPSPFTFPAATWHHVAYVGDAAGLRVYIDGALALGPAGGAPNNATSGFNFKMGGDGIWDATGNWYNGLMDDVGLWNRALTPAELSDLYNFGFGGPARLGNARLDPGTKIVLAGSGVGAFTSAGTVGGPLVNSPFTLSGSPATITAGTGSLTFGSTIDAQGFNVVGPGTVGLDNSTLNLAAGSALTVPKDATIITAGTSAINASAARLNYKGGLKVASGVLTLNPPAPVPLPANPMAIWQFNDGSGSVASDASGNNRFGTLVNSPTWVTDGVIGGSLSFNDTNNFVAVSRSTNGGINIDNQSFTLSAWTKISPTAAAADYFFGQGTGTTTRTVLHVGRRDANQETIAFYADDLNYANNALVSDTANWHHWVMTFDAATNTQSIWCDGVLRASRTTGGAFAAANSTDFWIGQANNGNWFGGQIDEAAVYGRVLNSTEIQNLYRAGVQGGYGAARFGNLNMADGTQIVVGNSNPVGFSTATFVGGAQINAPGGVVIDYSLVPNPNGTGTANITGPLTLGDRLNYEWSFSKFSNDLVTIVGDLRFDRAFTLELFGQGGNLLPGDIVPIFLFSGSLTVAGQPWNALSNPLQYLIQIGNLDDPGFKYMWDISDAKLLVNPLSYPSGIYLTGVEVILVPEPGTLALLGLGALALVRRRRRSA
ncbi:MAG TPA: PEP-CTERM sorting domain-containing protein [Planctomycetota bacterium]|nr:PEP-CTERM sorting domain-containing protein [Planctomycetota bacterium]